MTSKIRRLLKNYSNARQSWEAWCFMINFNCKQPSRERLAYIDSNDLLFHLRYLALKDFHIEIYKVLKEGKYDTDSVFKFLRETELNDKTKERDVQLNLSGLESCKTTIKELCDIRDKFYAHLDKDYEKYLITGTKLLDISKCFMAIEKSIITITSFDILQSYLDKIPSRDDLSLLIKNGN
jgi:hypothetical protein